MLISNEPCDITGNYISWTISIRRINFFRPLLLHELNLFKHGKMHYHLNPRDKYHKTNNKTWIKKKILQENENFGLWEP
jgi:hypothetical protein